MGTSSVVELILSNNSLTRISNWSLVSLPPSLRLLALDGNHLTELELGTLTVLDNLLSRDLRNIPATPPSSHLSKYLRINYYLLYISCNYFDQFFSPKP